MTAVWARITAPTGRQDCRPHTRSVPPLRSVPHVAASPENELYAVLLIEASRTGTAIGRRRSGLEQFLTAQGLLSHSSGNTFAVLKALRRAGSELAA